jgi:hypothetical protein
MKRQQTLTADSSEPGAETAAQQAAKTKRRSTMAAALR